MYHRRRKSAQRSINRNIVECKVYLHASVRHPAHVLIETSWNVKILGWFPASNCTGINRNIVECKAFFWMRSRTQKPGINRNIVECKDRYPSIHSPLSFVLIETSWNVKFYDLEISHLSAIGNNRNIVECKDTSEKVQGRYQTSY